MRRSTARASFIPSTPLSINSVRRHPKLSYTHPTCTATPPPQPSRRAFLIQLLLYPLTLPAIAQTVSSNSTETPSTPTTTPSPSSGTPPAPRPRKPTWGYTEADGPSLWGTLSEEWGIASTGVQQSPISVSYRTATPGEPEERPKARVIGSTTRVNIRMKELPGASKKSIQIEQYIPPPPALVGDAPPVDTPPPPSPPILVDVGNNTYGLKRVHIHAGGGEHDVDGTPANCEFHFEFIRRPSAREKEREREKDKAKDVTSVVLNAQALELGELGKEKEDMMIASAGDATPIVQVPQPPQTLVVALQGNSAEKSADWVGDITNALGSIEKDEVKTKNVVTELDMTEILPNFEKVPLYMYMGSLTTPPCTEGVQWIVLSHKVAVAAEDLNRIVQLQGGLNVRPLQQLNGRSVLRYSPLPGDKEIS